jgi:hypothetical protein
VHIWNNEEFNDSEVLLLETSSDRFILRSKEKYEKDKQVALKYLNLPGNIRFTEGSYVYINEKTMRAEEYGKEILQEGDLINSIINDDIKAEGDKYFEVSGTLHEYTSRCGEYGDEYDSETEIENLKFQEVAEEDVKNYLKEMNNE